jgi:photosystem I subunit PsaN
MAFAMSSTFVDVSLKAQTHTPAQGARCKVSKAVVCKADATSTRRTLLSLGALTAAFIAAPMSAKADLTEDLLAKTEANKVKNDKERLATSNTNFARYGLDVSIKKRISQSNETPTPTK